MKDDTNIHVLNWAFGSPNSIYLSNPQERASNKANNLIPSSCASCGVVWSHKTGTF
jgi:hypothetical protein